MNEVSQSTLEKASRYLAYKPRTVHELRRYLQEKGVSEEESEGCLAQMKEYHLVDDLDYCRMYIESMLERGRGMQRIRRELRQKGVDENTIEDALLLLEDVMEQMPDELQACLAQAQELLETMLGSAKTACSPDDREDEGSPMASMDYAQRQKLMGRLSRRLARQGFRTETVYRAVREAVEQYERSSYGL